MAVTTTHGRPGSGRPRLILVQGGGVLVEEPGGPVVQVEFELQESTFIGSSTDADLVFEGLEPVHAEILRDEADEYVVHDRSGVSGISVDGARVQEKLLRTGDRLQVGDVCFSFFREEFADHGRPYGGRQGGEFSDQREQPPRPSR
jgi:hypothetical protein